MTHIFQRESVKYINGSPSMHVIYMESSITIEIVPPFTDKKETFAIKLNWSYHIPGG